MKRNFRVLCLSGFWLFCQLGFATTTRSAPDRRGCETSLVNAHGGGISPHAWTPRFTSWVDKVKLVVSLLHAYPRINAGFNLDIQGMFELLKYTPFMSKYVGGDVTSVPITPPQTWRVRYYDGALSEANFKTFVEQMKRDLQRTELTPGQDLTSQFRSRVGTRAEILRLLRILPFIVKPDGQLSEKDGKPIMSWPEGFDLPPAALVARYRQFYNQEFTDFIAGLGVGPMTPIKEAHDQFKKTLTRRSGRSELMSVESIVNPDPSADTQKSVRALTLETLPSFFAEFKGYVIGDCTSIAMPYYNNVCEAKAFYIHEGEEVGKDPIGSVFMVKVKVPNRNGGVLSIPYFLTINGARLSRADVKAAIETVLHSDPDYACRVAAFPVWENNWQLVSWDNCRTEMAVANAVKMKVTFPPGFDRAQFMTPFSEADFYNVERIGEANVGVYRSDLDLAGPIETTQLSEPRYQLFDSAEQSGLSLALRAQVAAQYLMSAFDLSEQNSLPQRDPRTKDLDEILRYLGVTVEQARVARLLLIQDEGVGLSAKEFSELHKSLGLSLNDVLQMPYAYRSISLARIFVEDPQLFLQHNGRQNPKLRELITKILKEKGRAVDVDKLWPNSAIDDLALLSNLELRSLLPP